MVAPAAAVHARCACVCVHACAAQRVGTCHQLVGRVWPGLAWLQSLGPLWAYGSMFTRRTAMCSGTRLAL